MNVSNEKTPLIMLAGIRCSVTEMGVEDLEGNQEPLAVYFIMAYRKVVPWTSNRLLSNKRFVYSLN